MEPHFVPTSVSLAMQTAARLKISVTISLDAATISALGRGESDPPAKGKELALSQSLTHAMIIAF